LLISAVAERQSLPVFTTDRDFTRFASLLPISLHGRPAV
jgi:predicted nucleic acid-binding protein